MFDRDCQFSAIVELENSFSQIVGVTRRLGEINLSAYLIILVIILFIVKQFLLSVNKILW